MKLFRLIYMSATNGNASVKPLWRSKGNGGFEIPEKDLPLAMPNRRRVMHSSAQCG
jgi:hypothetical protein